VIVPSESVERYHSLFKRRTTGHIIEIEFLGEMMTNSIGIF